MWKLTTIILFLTLSLSQEEGVQTTELHGGANLISFYILPDDVSVSNVLSSLGDNVTGIIGEGVAGSHLGGGVWVGSLSEIDPTDGYWLIVNENDILIVTGSPVDPYMNFELHSGQNLISYPNSDSLEVTLAIPDEYELGFIGIISEGIATQQIDAYTWVGSLTEFQGGKGYWVNLTFTLDNYNYNIQGCTEPSACNYDENVDLDDGSCWYPNEVCECLDGEGAISDECGTCDTDSENDCILGCIDLDACNFNEDATDDDGSCEYPEECYDCFGCICEFDECGECGGDGPEEYYDCDGNCLNDEDGDGTCDELEGTVTDIDGNIYQTVQIGEQEWMAENLKVTHYNNGDEIQYVQSESSEPDVWENLSTGAYGYYNDDPSLLDTYGNLYNWYAVDDDREICPEGWHVPSDLEYQQLEIHLGMDPDEADDYGYRGTDEGSQLAGNEELWNSGDLENNEVFGTSGFTGIPAGYRYRSNGSYYPVGGYGYFWSSSEYGSNDAWSRSLGYNYSSVIRASHGKHFGFSVRCLGD